MLDVESVIAQVPGIPEEHVRAVLAALEVVRDGLPVGTIVQDPETSALAVRVSENGVHLWKVTALDGGEWRDMQPTLSGWKVLHQPQK